MALLLLAAGLAGLNGSPASAAAGQVRAPDGIMHAATKLAGKYGPKGHPAKPGTPTPLTACSSTCYYYNVGSQGFTGTLPTGSYGNITTLSPVLDTSHDVHSLAEVDAEKTVGGTSQVVEAGIIVDQNLNGDTQPRLFGYAWVNGVGQCYNACGWNDLAGVSPSMGDVISVNKRIGVEHFTSAQATPAGWWMWVSDTNGLNGNWVSYIADTKWSGATPSVTTFTNEDYGQMFGEVAAGETPSSTVCTDMGSPTLATPTAGSSIGTAAFTGIATANVNLNVRESPSGIQNEWNAEQLGTAGNIRSFRYGGPGGC